MNYLDTFRGENQEGVVDYPLSPFSELVEAFGNEILEVLESPNTSVSWEYIQKVIQSIHTSIVDEIETSLWMSQTQKFQMQQEVYGLLFMELQGISCISSLPSIEHILSLFQPLYKNALFSPHQQEALGQSIKRYLGEILIASNQYKKLDGLYDAEAKKELRSIVRGKLKKNIEGYKFQGSISLRFEQATLAVIFYSRRDYEQFVGKEDEDSSGSVGMHFRSYSSELEVGPIIAVDGTAPHQNEIIEHEKAHRFDGFVSNRDKKQKDSIRKEQLFHTAQSEIVAMLSENMSKKDIQMYLTTPRERYMPTGGELRDAKVTRAEYKEHVRDFISQAFEIREKYVNLYIHILSATPIRMWRYLLK